MFFQSPRTGPALKISQARLQRQNGNGREQGEPEPGAGAGLVWKPDERRRGCEHRHRPLLTDKGHEPGKRVICR